MAHATEPLRALRSRWLAPLSHSALQPRARAPIVVTRRSASFRVVPRAPCCALAARFRAPAQTRQSCSRWLTPLSHFTHRSTHYNDPRTPLSLIRAPITVAQAPSFTFELASASLPALEPRALGKARHAWLRPAGSRTPPSLSPLLSGIRCRRHGLRHAPPPLEGPMKGNHLRLHRRPT